MRFQRDTLMRRNIGIHTYYVDGYGEIPSKIKSFLEKSGPKLENTIENCLSKDIKIRSMAHMELQRLGDAGKLRASHVLRDRITSIIARNSKEDITELSELVYSLGKLDKYSKENKESILYVIENSYYIEPIAHAIVVLQEAFNIDDLAVLNNVLSKISKRQLETDSNNPDPDDRLPTYIEYIKKYVHAKYIH